MLAIGSSVAARVSYGRAEAPGKAVVEPLPGNGRGKRGAPWQAAELGYADILDRGCTIEAGVLVRCIGCAHSRPGEAGGECGGWSVFASTLHSLATSHAVRGLAGEWSVFVRYPKREVSWPIWDPTRGSRALLLFLTL